MSQPFRFVVFVEGGRGFEITGWGDDALEALRDALRSNTTAIDRRFPLGVHAQFTLEDLCIQERSESGGLGGYDVSFHPNRTAVPPDGGTPDAWAIRVSLSAV